MCGISLGCADPRLGLRFFLPRGTSVRLCYPCACNPSGWRKAIADMEHVMQVRLFDRTGHGVETTPYGSCNRAKRNKCIRRAKAGVEGY